MAGSDTTTRYVIVLVLLALWAAPLRNALAHGEEAQLPSAAGDAGQGDQGGVGMFVGELFARQMKAVRALMEQNRDRVAIERLTAMASHERAYNRYENALLQQTLGYARAQTGDYARAAAAFQKALSFKALPAATALTVLQNLGQLYIAAGRYQEGIAALESWMTRAHPRDVKPRLRVLLGNAYLHEKTYAKAAVQLGRAIDDAAHPDKAWFQLLVIADERRGRDADAAAVLQRAIAAYPRERAFWQQLAAAYRRLQDDKRAAATLALACGSGLCRDEDKLYLARLYLYLGAPLQAARLLQAGVASGTLGKRAEAWLLLAGSWQRAREPDKAVAAYREAAARDRDSGQASFRLAQLYVQQEKWPAAVRALTEALDRKHLEEPGRARLLLGVCQFYLGRLDEAAKWLKAAARDRDAAPEARRWLKQVAKASGHR